MTQLPFIYHSPLLIHLLGVGSHLLSPLHMYKTSYVIHNSIWVWLRSVINVFWYCQYWHMWMHLLSSCAVAEWGSDVSDVDYTLTFQWGSVRSLGMLTYISSVGIPPENYEKKKKQQQEKSSEMTGCLRGPNLNQHRLFPQKDAKIDAFLTQHKKTQWSMIKIKCWSRNLGDVILPNELPKKLPSSSYCNSLPCCGLYFHFILLLWRHVCWTYDEPACIHSPKCQSNDPTHHHPSPLTITTHHLSRIHSGNLT